MPTTDNKHIVLGLYGEPGIGKTRFVGTSPGRVCLLRPPVDHTNSLLPADKLRIEERVMRNWNDMENFKEEARHEGDKWDWVWVDSWSLLQDVLLDDVLEETIEESKNPKRRKYGPDEGVYGRNMFKIGAWMRHVIGPDLFNFGFTAHPAVLKSPDLDEDGDPVEKLMPWIQGRNMSPKLCGYTTMVAFLEGVGDKRRRVLRAQSDPRFYAKDQYDALDNGVLWDPTMPKLVGAIDQARGAKPSAPTKAKPKSSAKPRIRR